VSLHDTCKTLSDAIRRYIHKLSRHEMRRAEFRTDGQDGITRHSELFDDFFRMDACTLEVSEHLSSDVSRGMRTSIGAS
jgi:hypothetical protein